MAKMTKITVLCLIVASACLVQCSLAAPMLDNHEANEVVDEIIMKLKQLKLQGEAGQSGQSMPSTNRQATFYSNPHPEEIYRVHRTLDNLGGGYLLKRSSSNLDSLGGGYLLKRNPQDTPRGTIMDSLGGGYLL